MDKTSQKKQHLHKTNKLLNPARWNIRPAALWFVVFHSLALLEVTAGNFLLQDDAGPAVARRASVQWSAGTCEGTRHLAIVHHTKPRSCLTLGHTRGPGAAWYGIPASDLSSHYLFVLLYLQTIHCGDLPGKESAAKAWMMALRPPGCFLILSWMSGGRGRWEGEQPSPVSFSKLLSHHKLSLCLSHAEPLSSIRARLKKIKYWERVEYFWSVVSESEIIYSFITHRGKYFKLLFLVILTASG